MVDHDMGRRRWKRLEIKIYKIRILSIWYVPYTTVKRGNFDRRGNFDPSGSFVKVVTVPIQKCLFVASAFMEIND